MNRSHKKREKEIEAIFDKYNGFAVSYHTPKTSKKSISQICSTGSTLAPGAKVNSLINEIRK